MNHYNRRRFKAWLKNRISFRWHMSIVMFSMIFLGAGSNFLLLKYAGITHPAIRYPITVIISYIWFLIFLRIYLKNIFDRKTSENSIFDYMDLPTNNNGSSSNNPDWNGGGGQFSGGGASENWSKESADVLTANSSDSSVLDVVDGDEGAIVVVIIGAIAITIVFGTGSYFIWHSPEILSECLLQLLLASRLRQKMKKFSDTDWLNHIFKSTIKPVFVILFFSLILGFVLRHKCPTANTLKQFKQSCMR